MLPCLLLYLQLLCGTLHTGGVQLSLNECTYLVNVPDGSNGREAPFYYTQQFCHLREGL